MRPVKKKEEKVIRRFPRYADDYVEPKKKRFMGVDITNNRIPRGYTMVTKKMKRAARCVINGMTIYDMCHKVGINSNTWYRWLNLNKPFHEWYVSYARKQAMNIEGRLEAKAGRAVRVIEEALDSPDPYLSTDQAVKYLTGRGHYKKNIESNQRHSGTIVHGIAGRVKHEIVDKEILSAFVDALTGKAIGAPEKKEKVINVKVLKSLPEPQNGINTEIQESVEAETD